MAISGAQPQQPQQPHSQQPTASAMPAYQFNPYAQPPVPPGPPGPPGPPPAPPARGGGPRWLWALGGVVLASVTWVVTLMATGALDNEPSPDFRGHQFHHDMCETAKLDAFKKQYEVREPDSDNPDGYSSQQEGIDVSTCSRTLTQRGETSSTPPTTYVTTRAEWHKKSDPTGEFASSQRIWEDQETGQYKYEITPVKGFGDEAYLIEEQRGDTLGSLKLHVRAGWMTYEMSWSWFGGGVDEHYEPPSASEVTGWMKEDTRATLEALKQPDSSKAPGRDPSA